MVFMSSVMVSGRNHEVIMKIPNVKLGFRNASSQKQLVICDDLLAKLDKLPTVAQQGMDLPGLKAIVATAHASRQRIQRLKSALKHEVAKHKTHLHAAREAMAMAAITVKFNAYSEVQAITETGLPLAATWQKVGVPAAPLNLTAKVTKYPGEIQLRWKRTVRRCLFHVQMNTDPTNEKGWQVLGGTRLQSFTEPELKPGTVYWFRVRAENIHGMSPWSNLAVARAN